MRFYTNHHNHGFVSVLVVTILLCGCMIYLHSAVAVVVVVVVQADEGVSSSTTTTTNTDTTPQIPEEEQCGLYVAISSTSTVEDTNWGLFVGQDITTGIHTPIGNPEIAIVVSNLRIHNTATSTTTTTTTEEEDVKTGMAMKLVEYFESFFWVPSTAGAKFYFDTTTPSGSSSTSGERAIAAISGAGVLASYSKQMTNTDWDPKSAYLRPVQNEPSQLAHPNRGAISPYYHCQVRTTVNNIKAGSEVFMEYGESWAEKQNDDEELAKDDYVKIDETVAQMITFFQKYNSTVLDDDSRLEIYSFLMKDIMKAAVGAAKARRIASILPPNPNDLHLVPAAGGTLAYSDPTAHRSLVFLQKYGLCMDHVYSGPSTIPNIGRGAFAKRTIRSGHLVVPIPLTHVPDRSIFNMYPLTTNAETGKLVRASDTIISQQLIVNYCFGHPKSTMLFYPSGSMTTLINHSTEPNAKLQWSKHPNHQKLWYDFDPHTTLMEDEYMYMGLILEVVAVRDIGPDEEVFIDYGTEWQTAYDKHVKTWNKKLNSGVIPKEWPIRAVDVNAQYHRHDETSLSSSKLSAMQPFPTQSEDGSFPNADNLMVVAFLLLMDTENAGTTNDPKLWNTDDPEAGYVSDNLFEITILDRTLVEAEKKEAEGGGDGSTNNNYTYTVQWKNIVASDNTDTTNSTSTTTTMVVVTNVPHDAIAVMDRPGTSDQQYLHEHSFRHYIGIPDDIFPHGPWRNL